MHCCSFDVRDIHIQFIQLIIAVILLHALAWLVPASSPLKPHVTLPEINAEMAYKLLPVVSVGVIALGKFSSHSPHFVQSYVPRHPMSLSWAILSFGSHSRLPVQSETDAFFYNYPIWTMGYQTTQTVFNTLCLRNVDASFFQIARGLLLPCTIFTNALATRITPRSNTIRAAALVTAGFFLGISPSSFFKSSDIISSGEVIGSSTPSASFLEGAKYMWKDVVQNMDNEKALALVYGTLSALMTAIHAVLVKSAVKTLEGSVLRLNYWSNMLSGLFLVRHLPLYPWRRSQF